MKQLMLSVRPEHLVHILNGDKTLELRKLLPKNFDELVKKYGGIWVNLYCAKAKPYLYKLCNEWIVDNRYLESEYYFAHNGKVVARFWFDEYTSYFYQEYYGAYIKDFSKLTLREDKEDLKKLCLTYKEIELYGNVYSTPFNYVESLYAWHIKQLEIFDTPKELSDFYYFRTETVYCGMDCPPYVDEVKHTLRKAPQSYQYVYVKENDNEL